MIIEDLSQNNVDAYIKYLKLALSLEPDMMAIDSVDEKMIVNAIAKNPDGLCKSLLAFDDNKVIGRLEYHIYTCLQDMYTMAYVSWIYVLPEYRHKGVAQNLFKSFEKICTKSNVNQYFLIRADNKDAIKFYDSFTNAEISNTSVLRKTII